jgi:enoyl-[acyl-carrier-protein] reductase (NADH)
MIKKLFILLTILNYNINTFSISINLENKVAIITGGTRGIGYGIANSLAEKGYDLLLTYNTNKYKAYLSKDYLIEKYNNKIELVDGDLSLKESRDKIFDKYDRYFNKTHNLKVIVHNCGQYVGITSNNCENLKGIKKYSFGDNSLLENNNINFETMRYYQKLYGEAYIDLCERGLYRMNDGGSLIGISSPGCTTIYNPQPGYDMPGSGKTIMEYVMRLMALNAGKKNVNCNVIVPGAIKTDAWNILNKITGRDAYQFISNKQSINKEMKPKQIGDVVVFLCSNKGRYITGISLPVDGGLHLKI